MLLDAPKGNKFDVPYFYTSFSNCTTNSQQCLPHKQSHKNNLTILDSSKEYILLILFHALIELYLNVANKTKVNRLFPSNFKIRINQYQQQKSVYISLKHLPVKPLLLYTPQVTIQSKGQYCTIRNYSVIARATVSNPYCDQQNKGFPLAPI